MLRVVARDWLNPCACVGILVWFEYCPTAQFPPVLGDEGYEVQFAPGDPETRYLFKQADVEGRADFAIRAGGTCPAATVKVYTDGAWPLADRALVSPDQDGSLGVGADDLRLAESKLGQADPTADFDGDGVVTPADVEILRGHLGHHAPGMATPAVSRAWGTVKLLYR